jgi:drug/metabolite transporter (DMT)-like permease
MLVGAVSFALMGTFTHALGPRCDWLVVALVRAAFMLGSAVVLARSVGVRLVVFRPPTLWIRSIAGSISLVCNFYAIAVLPVADALTLMSMYPLWIVVISAIWLRRIPSAMELLGMASGLVGVALIQRPHLEGDGFAALVAVFSSATTAVALMGLHRLRHIDTRAVVAHFAGVGSLIAGTWLAVRSLGSGGAPVMQTDPTTLGLLLGVALSGTLGQICLTRAYALGVPTRVAVIGLSQVAFAMIFDVVLWGRVLSPLTLLGFAFVLAPTALLTAIARRRLADVALPEAQPGPEPEPEHEFKPDERPAPRAIAAQVAGD